jgi:hypothetical protein
MGSIPNPQLLRGAYNCLHFPFRKGGKGGFETWGIPLNPSSVALIIAI